MYRSTQAKARSALHTKKYEVHARISAAVMIFPGNRPPRRGGANFTKFSENYAYSIYDGSKGLVNVIQDLASPLQTDVRNANAGN